jgi:thiamine-phosphate pyrophosphorylase
VSARLYLFTPPVGEPAAFLPVLEAALGAGDIAAVLLRLEHADERTLINRAKAFAAPVQKYDIALILDGHAELAGKSGADGAHLSGIAALAAALPSLKPDRIAGAGLLRSRHDAMLAAESGADYAMFGEPDRNGVRPAFDAVVERVGWWAELFEPPCIAYAGALDEVAPLVDAGADFIALGDWIWTQDTTKQTAAQTIAAAAALLKAA